MDREREFLVVLSIKKDLINTTPVSGSLSLKEPICSCWTGLTRSYKVASFVFEEQKETCSSSDTRTSLAAAIDTQRLVRHSEGHSASLAWVEIKVRGQRCRKVVGSIGLEDFLGGLMRDGFLQMQDGKLILKLLHSPHQVLEESLVGTKGQSFEQAACTPPLEVTEAPVESERVELPDASLGNEASGHTVSTHSRAEEQPEIRRSTDVPGRFLDRLLGSYIEYLQRHHGVIIYRNKRRLHIKGSKDAVVACLGELRELLTEWRRREAAEAAALIAENQE